MAILKLYAFQLTFQKVKVFILVYFDSSHRERMDFISFMGGKTPGKQELRRCMLSKLTSQIVKVCTVVHFDSIYHRRIDFILSMGRNTTDKQEPQSCMLQTQFLECESFESSLVRQ